jgi:hypothetical protein
MDTDAAALAAQAALCAAAALSAYGGAVLAKIEDTAFSQTRDLCGTDAPPACTTTAPRRIVAGLS